MRLYDPTDCPTYNNGRTLHFNGVDVGGTISLPREFFGRCDPSLQCLTFPRSPRVWSFPSGCRDCTRGNQRTTRVYSQYTTQDRSGQLCPVAPELGERQGE